MKTKLFTLFFALMASVGTIFAQSGTCGENLTWNLTDSVLTISGTGEMENYASKRAPWYNYRYSITSAIIENGVTNVGGYAFYYCSALKTAMIGNSVTYIGKNAFYDCMSLTSINIPNSVTSIEQGAFEDCFSLPIVDNLQYADVYLVKAVDKTLSSISIRDGTKWIGRNAFSGCSSLTSVTIPNSVTSIEDYAFLSCSNLTYIEIPNSVTNTGYKPFDGCSRLTSVYLNSDAIVSKNYSSDVYSNIKSIFGSQVENYIIGNEVTSIGGTAFWDCRTLKSVELPNSITSIGENAFGDCYNLTSIEIPNSVTSIGHEAFSGCSKLASVTIPESVTSIGTRAFESCSSLTSVTIPDSVTSIEDYTFWLCSGLKSVSIGNNTTSIGEYAFRSCSKLTSITIPNSVTSIGIAAFENCSGLKSIQCEAITPPTCANRTFDLVTKSIPVYVPAGSVAAYQAADVWRNFTNILPIEGTEPTGNECSDPKILSWEPAEHPADMDRWYRFQTSEESDNPIYGSFSPIIPDTCDLRVKISNISDETARIHTNVHFDCYDPASRSMLLFLPPHTSDFFDIDRDFLARMGWADMLLDVSSNQNISIQAELIPNMPRDTIRDTIVAYVCWGEEYIDSITGFIYYIESSMTWIDTVEFRDGLQMKDSIIMFNIHPLIMPEPLSAEEMRGIGAVPLLVQGMPLQVAESNAALTEYYRNLGNSVDTITHIDTAYWAKPRYKADGSLDVKKEAPLDLSKYYSKNDYTDTLLLVVRSEECSFIMRIEYIFPIEGYKYVFRNDTICPPDPYYNPDTLTSIVLDTLGLPRMVDTITIYYSMLQPALYSQDEISLLPVVANGQPIDTTFTLSALKQQFADDATNLTARVTNIKWQVLEGDVWMDMPYVVSQTATEIHMRYIVETECAIRDTSMNIILPLTPEPCLIASGTCGENLTWTLSCDGVLTISGTGEMEGYSYSNHAPWYDNRSSINSVVITEGVTSIGDYAFHSYYGLTSVTFSNSVTTIGNYAFYKCSGLTSLRIGEHVTSFDYRSTFDGCNSLTYISVDASNPNYCSVDGVLFNKDATIIVQYPKGKQGAYTIPNSVTSVGRYAFRSCNGLTSITIPNSVTNIGYEAFSYCRNLISIEIPNSVTSIGSYAFDGCSNLTSITIPNSVKNIGSWAFMECSSITSVSIPSSVTTIGQCAFGDCSSLTSIEVATDNPNYCSVDGVLFNKEKNTIIQFPAGKEDQSYSIPTTVKTIYDRAFVGCSNLIDIMIPTSVTKIGQCVFGSCAFTSIIIPNSVTNIGMSAFWNCSNLSSITCEASTPPVCDLNAFDHVNKSIPVYVPIGSGDTYASADGWKDFTNILAILDIPDTPGPCLIASGTCGENLTWELSCDSVLTISGTGAMVDNPSWSPYVSQIKTVIMPEGLTIIGRNAFAECVNLESAHIPESVTAIGPAAFYNCSALTSINMPDSVRMLGHKAFVGCESLTEPVYNAHIFGFMPRNYCGAYSIPEGIVSVAAYAFCGIASATCSGLTEITIPSSVKRLGVEAFGLLFLRKITCLAVTPPTCDSTTFEWYLEETGITVKVDRSIPVYVPAESVDAYKAADVWKEFFNILPIGGTIEPQDSIYDVVYLDQAGLQLDYEPVTLHLPEAPQIEGFTFLKWQVVAGDLENGIHIQAVYTADEPTNAPEVYTNPANKAQKLIRNGKVYILTDDKVYSISGQKVK